MMYEELVKSIHCCFGFDSMQTDCENCMMKDKREEHNYVGCCDALGLAAADAIEELICEIATEHNERLDAEERQRWIPITERLPEPKRKVLISTEFGGVYYGFINERKQFITANDQYYDSWCWEPNASHWMPLPEPPEEGET